ncbi:MAG: SDR family NAD(P)-dependent oxidoreductase [Alphaproteobacteria bacterium]|nr:SDR family NAD(P)-dependent oxidoreductase [Alphaproteobacteria bacterium]
MRDLGGKVAFVTGGASGIGFALGHAFANAGAKVMLADIEEAALRDAVAKLEAAGADVRGVVCDVADPISVDHAADETIAAFGRVHILCNNAGVGAASNIDNIPLDSWRWVLDVNLMGVVHGIRSFLPRIRAHDEGGHIVNTASMAGMLAAGRGIEPYSATKFAVVAISEGLAAELNPLGIGVTVLCPGWVRTRIIESRRNRQQRYGPSPAPATRYSELPAGAAEPHLIAERTLAAVRRNELYAFTHPEFRDALEKRFQTILAAFDGLTGANADA